MSSINEIMSMVHTTLTDRERERFIDVFIQTYPSEVLECMQQFLKPSTDLVVDFEDIEDVRDPS